MREKLKRCYYMVIAAAAILAVLCLTYVRRWGNDVFEDSSADPGYVSASYLRSNTQQGLSYDHYLPDGYTLVAEGFEQIYFYPGTYRLSIDAQTISENAFYQVTDLWTNTILAEGTYDPGQSNHWLWFTTEETYQYVVVRSYVLTADLQEDGTETCDYTDVLAISAYSMFSDSDVVTDSKWELLLMLILAALIGCGIYRMMYLRRPELLALSAMSVIVSLPFAADFLPYGYDTQFHLARIYSLGQAFSEGQIPQRINQTITNGGITPILYPELLLYGAGFMVAAGTSVMLAYQAACVWITFLTSFAAYYAARQLCDTHSALLFAFLYLINPFRMNQVILLGAIGSAFAAAFLPLIAVGMWQILSGDDRKTRRLGAGDLVIGYTGLISCHIIMCVIAAFLCIVIAVCLFLAHPARFLRKGRRILWIVSAAGIVLMLNLWFLYPFLQYLGLETEISMESYERLQITEPYLWQVFMNVLGRFDDNGSSYSAYNEMSFSVGIALLAGMVLFAYFLIHDRMVSQHGMITTPGSSAEIGKSSEGPSGESEYLLPGEKRLGTFSLFLGMLFLYMSSAYCPWDWILEQSGLLESTLGRIQYSWRFLAIVALMLSAVLVIVIRSLNRQGTVRAAVLSGALILVSILTAAETASYYYSSNVGEMDGKFDASYQLYRDYFIYTADDQVIYEWYESGEGPLVLFAGEDGETGKVHLSAATVSGFEITDYHRDGVGYYFAFTNQSGEDITVTIPVLWYGLHTAYLVDSEGGITEELTPMMNEATQFTDILISGDAEEGTVVLTYEEPADYQIATLISLAALIILVILQLILHRRHAAG